VQPTDWQLSLMQPIYKGHDKDKTDPASYRGKYAKDTLAKLFEGLLLARHTTLTELDNTLTSTNLAPNLAHRHMTLSTLSFPPSNTTSIHFRNLHMWPLLTTPQSTPQCTGTKCHPFSCTMALLVICGTTFVLASTIIDFESCTPTSKNIKQLTSSAGSL